MSELEERLRVLREVFSFIPEELEELIRMEKDEKPAVEIELRGELTSHKALLKETLENLGYFVYVRKYGIVSSKIKSVAETLGRLFDDGAYKHAGAIGLLLGYDFHDIIYYLIKTGEDKFLNVPFPRKRIAFPNLDDVEEQFGKRYVEFYAERRQKDYVGKRKEITEGGEIIE